jgi:uncharacterized membrane protein
MTEPRGPKTWTPPPDREIPQRERKHEEPLNEDERETLKQIKDTGVL